MTKQIAIQLKVTIRGVGEFPLTVKIDGELFMRNWANHTDSELKELLLGDLESAVMAKLTAKPLKGEIVTAVSKLRRLASEQSRKP